MFPIVSGIIATDSDGNIAYGKSPIGKAYKGELAELDRQILIAYIAKIKANDLIVVGESTFQSMKYLFRHGHVMRSDEKGVGTSSAIHVGGRGDFHQFEASSPIDSLTSLYTQAITYAMAHHCGTIHVMGGCSVYEAFKRHYHKMLHCTFKGDISDKAHKPVTVYSDDIMDTKSLIVRVPAAVHIDNRAFSVVEYNLTLNQEN